MLNNVWTRNGQNEQGFFYSFAVSIYFFLVISALIVNSTMLAVLFRLRKQLFEPPGTFYTVVIELMAFTSLNSIVQAVFVAPQYIHQSAELASNAVFQRVYFVIDMVSNYGILAFSTLVAGNRYSTFYLGCTCPVFRRPRIYYLILAIFLIVIFLSALPSILGCSMLHAASAAGFVDFCPDEGLAERIKIGLGATYYVVCAISAQFYVRTYLLIKNQRGHLIEKENHRRAPEMIILKQALVIFGLYIISLVLTTILPLFSSPSSFLLSMSLNTVSLLLSIAYPGLFLVSCGEMRRDIISWVPFHRSSSCLKRGNHRVSSAESITSRYRAQSISESGSNWDEPSSAQFSGFSIAVVIYILLIIIALIINTTMLAVLLRLRKRLFQPPGTFYPVFVGLITFTFLNAIVQAVFVAPQYIQNTSEMSINNVPYLRVYFVLDMLSNYGILGFSTLVAANRFSTFNLGSKCPVFRRPRLYFLIFVVFLIVALLAATPSIFGCTMLQASSAASFVDFCPDEKRAKGLKIGLGAIYYVVCAFSAYLYVRTYWLIKNQRGHLIQHESHRKAPEMIILKQALVIFGLYIISLVLTTIVPLFSSSHSFLLSYFVNSISLLLSIAYPGLLLVSCGEMRRDVISWIPFHRSSSCLKRGNHRVSSAESISSRYRASGRTERN